MIASIASSVVVPDARLWLAGHEYEAEKDGTINVPYSTNPGSQPVVLMSGYSLVLTPERLEAAGVGAVLAKPFTPATLARKVREMDIKADEKYAQWQAAPNVKVRDKRWKEFLGSRWGD